MIEKALSKDALGPCLSTDLTEYLINRHGLKPDAARQRVRRANSNVKRLAYLKFARGVRFMYLEEDYASPWFWSSLYNAIYTTKGPYARALGAVDARDVVTISDFHTVCGSPIAQKKQVSSQTVLDRMTQAGVFVQKTIPGLGLCVMTKQFYEAYPEHTLAFIRSRNLAEKVLLDSIKEWLKRLAIASFDKVQVKGGEDFRPKVGTFYWDLTAPSYLSPLVTWQRDNPPKPGFVVCDVLLNSSVSLNHIEPYIHKVKALKAFKNIGSTLFIFVASHYQKDAFQALREIGCIPATPESLFGKDIAEAFNELIYVLGNAASGAIDPARFDDLFGRLSKLEGAVGNMRGAFFELLVAHIVRQDHPGDLMLNKQCKDDEGRVAEIDVYATSNGKPPRIIECKGMAPDIELSDDEIGKWLTVRIKRVREFLNRTEVTIPNGPKPIFELWTSGKLSEKAKVRIDRTRDANRAKFELVVVGPEDIRSLVKHDKPLLQTLEQHFLPHY